MPNLADHYRTLELSKGVDYKSARQQKNDLLLVWHPDKHQKNERVRKKAEKKTREINEAWQEIEKYFQWKRHKEANAKKTSSATKKNKKPSQGRSPSEGGSTNSRRTRGSTGNSRQESGQEKQQRHNQNVKPKSSNQRDGTDSHIPRFAKLLLIAIGIYLFFVFPSLGILIDVATKKPDLPSQNLAVNLNKPVADTELSTEPVVNRQSLNNYAAKSRRTGNNDGSVTLESWPQERRRRNETQKPVGLKSSQQTAAKKPTRIDINKATAEELGRLPGIGPSRVSAILENRRKFGRFKSCDDLQRIYGIGPNMVRNLKKYCTVSAPSKKPVGLKSSQQTAAKKPTRIDINKATAEELGRLPGIGPSRVSAILENRRKFGRFKSCDDLQRIYGIGPTTVRNLKKVCTVSAP